MKKNTRFAVTLLLMFAFAFTSFISNAQRAGHGGFSGEHFGSDGEWKKIRCYS